MNDIKSFPQNVQSTPEDSVASELNNEASTSESNKRVRKKKPLLTRLNSATMMWIRRIHLFSGLFMLPWVLLYGFTAMLFNHSTWFSDSRIETVYVDDSQLQQLPVSDTIASEIVDVLRDSGVQVELADTPDALFTRSAFASYETEKTNESLIIDLNSGKSYRRIREKPPEEKETESSTGQKKKEDLATGMGVSLNIGDRLEVTDIVKGVEQDAKSDKPIKLQSVPTLEFNAIVDGEPKRLRFSQRSNRRRGGQSPNAEQSKTKVGEIAGTVSEIGGNPRDLSWRSYLLRLHLAHGYPNTANARYWWAYAVDAMFLCMVFWGLSGVFMWWQIKRTRKLGFILLGLSAIIATYLAYAMHWQIANG